MKIYTSYFYQIRNFPKNLIPLSTAVSGPKWFYPQHFDKRGVLNGIRAWPFVPQMPYGLCLGQPCEEQPYECEFLNQYYKQLNKLDFLQIMERFVLLKQKLCYDLGLPDIDFALMVYEVPNNPCSERQIIHRWFNDHNQPIKEWSKVEIF